MSEAERSRLAFWIHQVVEYLVGGFLFVQGVQSTDPLVPALAGLAVLAVATTANAPLSAFKVVPRPVHRMLDVGLLVVFLVLAVTGLGGLSAPVRVLLAAAAVAMAALLLRTDYRTPLKKGRRGTAVTPPAPPAPPSPAIEPTPAPPPVASEPPAAEGQEAPAMGVDGKGPPDADGPEAPPPSDPPRAAPSGSAPRGGEAVGRAAGRFVGKGVNAYRKRKG